MKNKGLIYALILVVAAIWYNVFFRVVSNLSGDDADVVAPNETRATFSSIDRDTFSLQANYRDPFGGSTVAVNAAPLDAPIRIAAPVVKPIKVKEPWSVIRYKGLVRKTSSSDPLAIIYIDGIQMYMRKGDVAFDGITLKTVHKDSIVVWYKKEKRVFWRD
jgi:hypothetical protein